MNKNILLMSSLLFLVGCGGRAPLKRAEEILFEVPYTQQKNQYESLEIGVKKLSVPEIKELFCKTSDLIRTYHVYYVRTHNVGGETYFVHLVGQSLPSRKDISVFFDPYTIMHTVAHVAFVVVSGIALMRIAPDSVTYFAGFIGLNAGLHLLESQVLGLSGYQDFEKHVLVRDSENQMASIAAVPYAQNHHIVFVPLRDAQSTRLRFNVSAREKVAKEIEFDFSADL